MNILGIDIGGTKTIVAVADENGSLITRKRIKTATKLGPQRVMADIKAAAHEVIKEAGSPKIDCIGIGCGGPLDRAAGRVLVVPNLPGWDNLPLTQIFAEEFGVPAYLDNDATAAALAEAMFGAGKDARNMCYFTISTGIGGGIILEGKPYRGSSDNSAEFGHQVIEPNGPKCPCGRWGCLESLSSGTSIARQAREAIDDHRESLLWTWSEGVKEKITAEMVAKAAGEGDSYAREVWYRAVGYLGIGVANVVSIINPDLVVLGGGVTKAGAMLFEPVRETVVERVMPALAEIVRIVPAELGDDVGIVGAVAIALEATEATPQKDLYP